MFVYIVFVLFLLAFISLLVVLNHKKMLTKNMVLVITTLAFSAMSIIFLFCFPSIDTYKSAFFRDSFDSEMDFHNSLIEEKFRKERLKNYPPLAILMYRIGGKIVPADIDVYSDKIVNETFANWENQIPSRKRAFGLRNILVGRVLYLYHILIFVIPLFIISNYFIKGSTKIKNLWSVFIVSSWPVFYALERGNIIVYALIFTLLFVLLYRREDKLSRILAFVCLAIAFNIKLYPAIFGLLILEKKDWKGALLCVGFAISIYLVAFVICYDIRVFFESIENIFAWASNRSQRVELTNFSIINFTKLVNGFLVLITNNFFSSIKSPGFYKFVLIFCFLSSVFMYFFSKDDYKKLFSLSALCIYIPNISYAYSLVFLLLPLIAFIEDEKESKFEFVYAFCFAVMISTIATPLFIWKYGICITVSNLLKQSVLFLMYVMIFVEAIRNCIIFSKNKLKRTNTKG